ncbi:three-deoxy-D-manno-octulosonic-acid transferase domain protein [Luminiphilus syltensis NOR5-1B]|uniref:3-deoxy-D-manno-octulosonic acid transferase n=1 Tax=Luminiphilus syltensis NOR5-1B TaxID=565045 RepID=B8KUL8_9GAMM|nr:lipid IV(A) 3-deoxy-D-manno-octulosonic acid transferase [Luminiphilus syltensis]EED35997.1 three-deoxy-D-manno-octulosonic-acid transferase domain protein [Luminiphilus syltensis NOR5-1B]
MTRFLYSILMRLSVPIVLARLLWRSRRNPGYRAQLRQRLGFDLPVTGSSGPMVWIHAVSVGETLAVAPLIESLLSSLGERRLLVTSTTPTGAAQVQRLFGDRVLRTWFPIDTPGAVRRHLDHWQPGVVVLVETEIWPNLIHGCGLRDCPVLLVNARLSARSARGYARLGDLSREAIGGLRHIACQSRADARRFKMLGGASEQISVVGSIKYDIDIAQLKDGRDALMAIISPGNRRWILVAASTHPGEEEIVVNAFKDLKEQRPDALLVLAPRHPERSNAVAKLVQSAGLRLMRRTESRPVASYDDVLLLDTLGELALAQGTARLAFIGGSLVSRGGHNPLEAAAWGVPVISGASVDNFATIYRDLTRTGGALVLQPKENLGTCLVRLAADEERLQSMGVAGQRWVAEKRGALDLQCALIQSYYSD